MKQAITETLAVLKQLVWRAFGAFLFIAGAAAGTGAVITGSWITGVLVAWGTLMLGIVGAIGYAIMIRGRATTDDVEKAYRDAAEKVSDSRK